MSNIVKNIVIGELNYPSFIGDEDPPIELDSVNFTLAIKLNKKSVASDFKIKFHKDGKELLFDAHTPANSAKSSNFVHFSISELSCKSSYSYTIEYKETPLQLFENSHQVFIKTPPARRDPQPIRIACGGDQECHEQFNPIARLFDLNNSKQTGLIYDHIGQTGNINLVEGTEEEPYDLVLHLSDLIDGEKMFDPFNFFRKNRHIVEWRVKSKEAYEYHLEKDFGKPLGKNLAHISGGLYVVFDDHDLGENNAKPPKNEKEIKYYKNMQESFHEFLLTPHYIIPAEDPQASIIKPFYKKRIGQSEFF